MDNPTQKQLTQKCLKHSQKISEFLQVNDISNSQNNDLFYCTSCINQDLTFKGINYLLISQIIEEGDTNIIQKWPPVNDYSIIDQLIQYTQLQKSSASVINEINIYFSQFKEEFLSKVDICQKKMINRAHELPFAGKESVIQKYQHISQITKLRSILIEGNEQNLEAYAQSYKSFISSVESQKETNTELLSKLLQECNEKEELINFEFPNLIKRSLFTLIDEIDFFDSKTSRTSVDTTNNKANELSNSNKIMKLISNKSNFCSDSFLSQLQVLLDKINPLLSSISFENMIEKDKTPINFSSLSSQRLDQIQDIVNHFNKIQSIQEYSHDIQKSDQYKQLYQIVERKTNFLSHKVKEQLKEYLIQSYPLFQQYNLTHITDEDEKFDSFGSLSDVDIEDLFQLIQKRKQVTQQQEYDQSQTKYFNDQTKSLLTQFDGVDEIFNKYPIFDLLKKKKTKEQQIKIKLTATPFLEGTSRMEINSDNQIWLNQTQYKGYYRDNWVNFISDIVLEKEKKYIFRIYIEHFREDIFELMFGLTSHSKCQTDHGWRDYMSYYLNYINKTISYQGGYGIDQLVKGDNLKLSQEKMLELRVCLVSQQLELLDYPHYQYRVAIKDMHKSNLTALNDLKLYIGIRYEQIKVTLINSLVVDDFPN